MDHDDTLNEETLIADAAVDAVADEADITRDAAGTETELVDEMLVDEMLIDEMLIEEISIDGMCGVY
jgi:mycofactocin precursor